MLAFYPSCLRLYLMRGFQRIFFVLECLFEKHIGLVSPIWSIYKPSYLSAYISSNIWKIKKFSCSSEGVLWYTNLVHLYSQMYTFIFLYMFWLVVGYFPWHRDSLCTLPTRCMFILYRNRVLFIALECVKSQYQFLFLL